MSIEITPELQEHINYLRGLSNITNVVIEPVPDDWKDQINNVDSVLFKIYKNEIYESIRIGDKLQGYVKRVREDEKIDLSLQKSGYELVDDVKWRILKLIKDQNGILALNDNSSPEEIKSKLQISKKAFKKAVGALYRERLVKLTDKGVELI